MRCSKTAGFHGRSTLITVFAACKFKPVEPAFVVRNRRHSGLLWNSYTNPCLSFCGTEPSRRTNRRRRFFRRDSVRSSILVHSEKSSTLRFSSEENRSNKLSSSSSFEEYPGVCLSTRNVLLADIR